MRRVVAGSIGLLALAGLVAIYAAWSFGEANAAVQAAIEAGQLSAEGSEYDVLSYVMSSSGLYAILAIVLAALAWLLLRTRPEAAVGRGEPVRAARRSADDDDLDELLGDMVEEEPQGPAR